MKVDRTGYQRPAVARPKFIVTRTADREEVIGIWYDVKKGLLCVGGHGSSTDLGKVLAAWFLTQVPMPRKGFRVPVQIRGDHRWMRSIPCTSDEFEKAIWALRSEWADGDAIQVVGPVRRFGRLTW